MITLNYFELSLKDKAVCRCGVREKRLALAHAAPSPARPLLLNARRFSRIESRSSRFQNNLTLCNPLVKLNKKRKTIKLHFIYLNHISNY